MFWFEYIWPRGIVYLVVTEYEWKQSSTRLCGILIPIQQVYFLERTIMYRADKSRTYVLRGESTASYICTILSLFSLRLFNDL